MDKFISEAAYAIPKSTKLRKQECRLPQLVTAGIELCRARESGSFNFWDRFGSRSFKNGQELAFSDFDYMELVLDAEAVAIGADPYVMIRPEGNGTSLGFLELSGSSGEPPHRPGCTMGFLVASIRWTGQSSLFNTATRFSRWIEGFEPWRSDMVFERGKPSCYASAPFCEVMECGGGSFVLAGFAAETACLATALDVFSRGHRLTFLADASASHRLDEIGSNDVHPVVTRVIELYGDVLGTGTWISATSRTRRQRRVMHGSEHDYSA